MNPDLPLYDENPDFNAALDEQHGGDCEVLGEPFRPSWILYNLAPETYRIALTDYLEQLQEMETEAG